MASKAVVNSALVLRILTLLLLAASVVVMATNNFKFSDGTKTSFTDVIAYRYVAATGAVGFLYTVAQIPFAVYHACTEKRPLRPEFDFYGDKVISLLLGTGVGAGFAVTFEFKRNLNDFVQGVEDLSGQDLSEFKSKTEKFLDRATIATVTKGMLSKIVGLTIASWRFGTLSREPILQHFTLFVLELRTEIQSIKKDGLIPDEYVVKVKNVVDKLGSIGKPVLDKDQLIYLFQGLGAEYNPFVTSFNDISNQPTIEEVHSLLLSFDLIL
ncbi:hypothetical protein VitviT2T_026711 [Vitis vinifera]|uniref:CASP-like protein n=1 Tax=Vitis vinifera TaxID=29760 RepID=A0ABY9DMS8_VITVI|nr:hypothetical protein VitviT2T_026711 [Vitis vinifera]